MPALTPELELELLEDELLLLPDELALVLLPPDLPPALGVELEAEARPKNTPVPGRCMAMLASMGDRPRANVISQRVRFIRSLRAIGLRSTPSVRRANGQSARTHDYPRVLHDSERTNLPARVMTK